MIDENENQSRLQEMWRIPEKTLRLFELVLVWGTVFGVSLLLSLYLVVTMRTMPNEGTSILQGVHGIVTEVLGLALLAYVLARRGNTFRDLGLDFRLKDAGIALIVALAGYLLGWLFEYALVYGWFYATGKALPMHPRNVNYLADLARGAGLVIGIPFMILNPFAEELIARAYVMTEVRYLTGKMPYAILVSVVLQSAYHLYQGVVPAFTYAGLFLAFSLYYARFGRIMPVILAHMIFDVTALLFAGGSLHRSH